MAVPVDRGGRGAADIPLAAAAVEGGVAVEQLGPVAAPGDADAVIVLRVGREIADDQGEFAARPRLAEHAEDAVLGIVAVDPLEAVRLAIELVQRRLAAIERVEVA